MPTKSPFRYEDDRNEESVLAGDSDSPLTDRSSGRGAPQMTRAQGPQTFAQMQARGEARPPMPQPSAAPLEFNPNMITTRLPNLQFDPHPVTTTGAPPADTADSGASEGNTNDLLERLLAGLEGRGRSGGLRDATNAALLDQLNSSSPYDSEAVRNEYDFLAGNIDDEFAQRERATDESMARRGLYGSAGKDFHSGRLSDLNVGRRSAKTNLAQDLASNYAKSAADYRRSAIGQAMAGAGAANDEEMGWLQALLGYGQQGFENDMTTAAFNHQQNIDYENLLQQLMAMGYA